MFDDVTSLPCDAYLSQKDESFYTLSWACNHVDDSPLLVVGGSNGIIQIINYTTKKLLKVNPTCLYFCGEGE